MNNQWQPPVPARPSGWTPQPLQDQQQYQQYSGQPYQQGHPPQFQQQYPERSYQQIPPPSQYQQYPPQSQQQYQQYPPQAQYAPQQYQSQQFQPSQYAPQPYQQSSGPQYQQSSGQYQQNLQYSAPPLQYEKPQARQYWQPKAGTTWQMVLHDPVELDDSIEEAEVWNVDVFDTPAESVAELHRRGRKVIAYFSGGTYEDWRDDAKKFPKSDIGKSMEDWEGEKWVQTSSPAIRQIMIQRIELALSKGFDGIDVDNIDGYDHKTGLGLSHDSAVDYIKFLSREAHMRGLACGLKNASDIIPRVIDDVQWIVQEQCVQYGDEEEYLPFIRAGKPVFHVEYPKGEDTESSKCNNTKEVTGKALQKCMKAKNMGFSTIIKNIKLDQWVQVV